MFRQSIPVKIPQSEWQSILAYILGTSFFSNRRFMQEHNK